jgi:hypothetical protein
MAKPLRLFILIAAILSIPYLWQEHFTLNSTINYDKIGSYFTLLAAVGAVFSIVLLSKQNDEIFRSNREVNRPELFVAAETFWAEYIDTDESSKPFVALSLLRNGKKSESEKVGFKIENIGNGVAKHLSANWIYNHNDIKAYVKDLYEFPDRPDLDTRKKDFLKTDQAWIIYPPISYFSCCGNILNRTGEEKIGATVQPKPELILELRYHDISGFEYSKQFDVAVEAILEVVVVDFSQRP